MIYCPVIDYEFKDATVPADVKELCNQYKDGRCEFWQNEGGECLVIADGG